ncbi:MAG: metal ABC transporter permease [Deltaproteobacteria bacterium]|nr:metal ABC transporter permease [Deltaproteobacteria bacterium]
MESLISFLYSVVGHLLPLSFAEPEFMKRAILAVLFVAPAAAAVGVPLVQFRMAFFSDAIGHSAFTGVALGVLAGIHPLLTMVAFGLFVAWAITQVKGRTGLSPDTVIGVFFSTVVALGIAIISARKGLTRNLQGYLYGDLLAISGAEVIWMGALSASVAAYLFLAFNRILLLGVNEGFARSLGVKGRALETSFALVVALVVTTAIRAVGILLVTALLVVPAAAARNVARGAGSAFWIATAISLVSGLGGIAASYYLDTATGATIVLCAAAFFALTAIIRLALGETA